MAYLGDAVLELAARERLVKFGNLSPERLHFEALSFVAASKQSKAVENILPLLTAAETEVYKRGRNAKGRAPKSASVTEYRRATGMECLFGYLYLSGGFMRISELFDAAFKDV